LGRRLSIECKVFTVRLKHAQGKLHAGGSPLTWMASRQTIAFLLGSILLLGTTLLAVVPASAQRITLIVPGQVGGGYDRTAVALQDALMEAKLVEAVELVRSPGAGGIVALAQFIERRDADHGDVLLVGGQSMLGSTRFNRSTVSLTDVTALARMNSIALVIAVRRDSPVRNWSDLVEAMRQEPAALLWVGGSEGSVDEQLIRLIGEELRIPRHQFAYLPIPGGGTSVADRVVAGSHLVAVSSYEELAGHLADGRLRAIAVSGSSQLPGVDAPTLGGEGLAIDFSDWKGVFAVPGISVEERARLTSLMESLARSPAWRRQLEEHQWHDNFLAGEPFSGFVQQMSNEAGALYVQEGGLQPHAWRIEDLLLRPYRWLALSIAAAALLTTLLLLFMRYKARRDHSLQLQLEESLADAREARRLAELQSEAKLASITENIEREFKRWMLTDAERDIGWLLLKGFSFKEIATLRDRSERTVRQQAGSIYAKSGLANRSELAAWFLEDLLAENPENAQRIGGSVAI
jgi:putative tricarboxylic transport membrane protein